MFDITNDAGSIDMSDPVDWDAYRELIGTPPTLWMLGLPQWRGGRWPNLAAKRPRAVIDAALTNGPLWESPRGRPGGYASLSCDGVNDYAIASNYVHGNNTAISIGAWIYSRATSGTYLIDLDNHAAILADFQAGFWNFFLNGNYPSGTPTDSRIAKTNNVWQHVLYTSDGTTCQGYLNGVLKISTTSRSQGTTSAVNIGRYSGNIQYSNALIDDVQIWNVALASAQSERVVSATLAGYPNILRRTPGRSYFWVGGGVANPSVSVTPATATAAATALIGNVQLGSLSITPANAAAAATALVGSETLSSVSVTPSPASCSAAAVLGSAQQNSLSISPANAAAAGSASLVSGLADSLAITPEPAAANSTALLSSLELSSLTVTPLAAIVAAVCVAPSVSTGTVTTTWPRAVTHERLGYGRCTAERASA